MILSNLHKITDDDVLLASLNSFDHLEKLKLAPDDVVRIRQLCHNPIAFTEKHVAIFFRLLLHHWFNASRERFDLSLR